MDRRFVFSREPPYLSMDEVLLAVEKRVIPKLDIRLLAAVAQGCTHLRPEIKKALRGRQRDTFRDLCAYVATEDVIRAIRNASLAKPALEPDLSGPQWLAIVSGSMVAGLAGLIVGYMLSKVSSLVY